MTEKKGANLNMYFFFLKKILWNGTIETAQTNIKHTETYKMTG